MQELLWRHVLSRLLAKIAWSLLPLLFHCSKGHSVAVQSVLGENDLMTECQPAIGGAESDSWLASIRCGKGWEQICSLLSRSVTVCSCLSKWFMLEVVDCCVLKQLLPLLSILYSFISQLPSQLESSISASTLSNQRPHLNIIPT